MELDDFKNAWHALDARLSRQDRLQLEQLRERKLEATRRGLRGLFIGQWLQVLLGIALVVLGVACWTRNTHVPGLLAGGIALHAFGVLTAALAGLTIALASTIDYSAPVTTIQRQLARLQRFYGFNAAACGAPWWVMWVLVVVAVSGLSGTTTSETPTPAWITASVWLGVAGTLATWAWAWHRRRHHDDPAHDRCDGGDGIRRGRRLLEEVRSFETE